MQLARFVRMWGIHVVLGLAGLVVLAAVRAPRTRRPKQRQMRRAAKSCNVKLNRRRGRELAPAKRARGKSQDKVSSTDFNRLRSTAPKPWLRMAKRNERPRTGPGP